MSNHQKRLYKFYPSLVQTQTHSISSFLFQSKSNFFSSLNHLSANQVNGRVALYFHVLSNNYKQLTENSIRSYFEDFGQVEDVRIIKDFTTGHQGKWGIILFKDPSLIDKLLSTFNQINVDSVSLELKKGELTLRPDNQTIPHFGFSGFQSLHSSIKLKKSKFKK